MLKRIHKKLLVAITMIAIGMGGVATANAAETTLKGVNANGFYSVVGTDAIYAAKWTAGVMQYKTQGTSAVFSITDATAANYNAWLATISNAKYATEATQGFTFALTKVSINCQSGTTTTLWAPNVSVSEVWTDNCNFYTLANSK